jgi:2-C-methyl-D-erythritol 4-phosphate cytidylyltransferase
MKACVIVVAAGKSTRFGSSDKLLQDLGGRPLLVRAVEAFTKRPEVSAIVVAGPPDEFQQFCDRYGATLGFHGAKVVEGGRTARWESVRNALDAVPDDCTHIAVHDAARPVLSGDLLDRVFEAGNQMSAVIPGIPVQSTVKRVSDEVDAIREQDDDALADTILGEEGRVTIEARTVTETVDRRGLYEIQTPQIFKADLLRRAYAEQDNLHGATDDASLVERMGATVHVVDGDVTNVKVTRADDIRLVRALLGVKPPAERPVHKRF